MGFQRRRSVDWFCLASLILILLPWATSEWFKWIGLLIVSWAPCIRFIVVAPLWLKPIYGLLALGRPLSLAGQGSIPLLDGGDMLLRPILFTFVGCWTVMLILWLMVRLMVGLRSGALVAFCLHWGWLWLPTLLILGLWLKLPLFFQFAHLLPCLSKLSLGSTAFLFSLLFLLFEGIFGPLAFLVEPLDLPLALVSLVSEGEFLSLSLWSLLLEPIDLICSFNHTLLDHLQTSLQTSILSNETFNFHLFLPQKYLQCTGLLLEWLPWVISLNTFLI